MEIELTRNGGVSAAIAIARYAGKFDKEKADKKLRALGVGRIGNWAPWPIGSYTPEGLYCRVIVRTTRKNSRDSFDKISKMNAELRLKVDMQEQAEYLYFYYKGEITSGRLGRNTLFPSKVDFMKLHLVTSRCYQSVKRRLQGEGYISPSSGKGNPRGTFVIWKGEDR